METIYKSEDGHHFKSRRACKLYEKALKEIEYIDHLQYEIIDDQKFYKINSEAELYFFDHLHDTPENKSEKTLYEIFNDLEDKSFRFPIWIREDGMESKQSLISKYEEEINSLKDKIDKLKENINSLKALDSRSKTPVIEEIKKEEENIRDIEEEKEEVEPEEV